MRIVFLACALCLISFAALADDEIVFRLTEEQTTAACSGTGSPAIYSEDGGYALICRHWDAWSLTKKGDLDDKGDQLWHPVVLPRSKTPEPEARP